MNPDDFKKLLDESLKPIKADLSDIKKTLDHHTDVIDNQLLPSVSGTESTIKVYDDMYKLNNDNMIKLEKRLEPLEDRAGIQPPPEFTITKTQ